MIFALNIPTSAGTSLVSIYPDSLRQNISGIGGNLSCGSPWGPGPKFIGVLDTVGRYNLVNLKPCPIVRVGLPMRQWEPVNDDTNAFNFNWSKLHDTGAVHQFFLDLQELKAKYGVSTIIGSIWTLPDWLDSLEPNRSQIVPMALWPEMLESIASLLIRARDTYGVTIDYVSFNEPDMGIYVLVGSTDLARVIKQAGPRFAALGLTTQWLGSDGMLYTATHGIYQIAQDVTAMKYVGPFSYHSYHQEEGPYNDDYLRQIASIARTYNRETWVAEVGYDPNWNNINFQSWIHAWRMAIHSYRCLKYAQASTLLIWTYSYNFTLLGINATDSSLIRRPAFYAWKHLSDNLLPGSRVVDAVSNDTLLWSLAAKHDSMGHFMVQLLNCDSLSAKTVKVSGIPAGVSSFYHYRTRNGENMALVDSFPVSAGSVTLTLPPQSINTLRKGKSPTTGLVAVKPAQNDGLLLTASPNPCNPSTRIRYTLPNAPGTEELVTLDVLSSQGQRIRTLFNGILKTVPSEAVWDGKDKAGNGVAGGIYICRLRAGKFTKEFKLALIK